MATTVEKTPESSAQAISTGAASSRGSLLWLDLVKALAMIWIVLSHLSEQIFGDPFAGNPAADWPLLAERIAQMHPLPGGIRSIPINVFRYVGWSGDNGVAVFLVASGFGLAYGLFRRNAPAALDLWAFFRSRVRRIYPLWWGAHIAILPFAFVTIGITLTSPDYYLSALGIRVTPALMYYLVPAWWFMGLLLQLYAVFPILWGWMNRFGTRRFLAALSALGFLARAAGLFSFGGYIDEWSRGAIFVTRLPEFALGMALAAWYASDPAGTERRLRAPLAVAAAVAAFALGFALSFSLAGMIVAPFLMGAAAFVIFFAALPSAQASAGTGSGALAWIGRHSYSIYLVHQPFVTLLVKPPASGGAGKIVLGSVAAFALTAVGAVILEWGVARAEAANSRLFARSGLGGVLRAWGAALACLLIVLFAANAAIARKYDFEVYGWGERPSLQPDPVVGWKLIPSRTTHLHWRSYDYRITANALGFPGPDVSEQKPPGTLRIMTTGDAFTSAEGVDADRTWPRLLEQDLARKTGKPVQVLNFAITGYGPNQYAAVVRSYATRYRPDIILMEFFVNDYQDVLESDDQFRADLGLGRPDPNGWQALVSMQQLSEWFKLEGRVLKARLAHKPDPVAAAFGDLAAFDRQRAGLAKSRVDTQARLREIEEIAGRIGARVIIAMAPSSLQVCRSGDLGYETRGLLSDTVRYDPELPQRMTHEIADSLGITYIDLRPLLSAEAPCPYQPHNMHWTQAGHELVARYLTTRLSAPR